MSSSSNSHSKSTALDIIKNYRVSELQALLDYGNLPRQGQKRDLLQRCKILINTSFTPQLANKIHQINNNRLRSIRSNHVSSSTSSSSSSRHQPIMLAKTPPREILPASNQIQFATLPFYDKMRNIESANMPVDWASFSPLRFGLNETDIELIRKNSARIFLRIAPTVSNERHYDVLPPYLCVQCNNQLVINNNVSKTVGSQAHSISFPTDITDKIIFKANASNTLSFLWLQSPTTMSLKNLPKSYTLCIQLVHCVSLNTLFDMIVKREPYQNQEDHDSDIEVEDLGLMTTRHRVSLLCPITQSLICVPAKSSQCSHLTCFDLKAFLQMNERRLQWTCPLCKKAASFDSLRVDHRLQSILAHVPPNCSTVEIDSSTDYQYIFDCVKQEKVEVTEPTNVDDENGLDSTLNLSTKSRQQQSDESDCIVLSSGSESESENENEDEDDQPEDLSRREFSDRSVSPLRINLNPELGEIRQRADSYSVLTPSLITSTADDGDYWEDIAQLSCDLLLDQNEKVTSRKRANSSESSHISSRMLSPSSSSSSESSTSNLHQYSRKRRKPSSTNNSSQQNEIEVITISSSDTDDNADHID